jgi:hypothetical protein
VISLLHFSTLLSLIRASNLSDINRHPGFNCLIAILILSSLRQEIRFLLKAIDGSNRLEVPVFIMLIVTHSTSTILS